MKYLGPPQSGSQAGTTASHNRAGQYYRSRRAPVQPVGTGRRAFIRSAFGASSSGWASLSPANQASWIAFANGHPITDALGQSITLTGQQMYVSVATQLQNVGEPMPTVPPVSTTTTAPNATVFTVTSAGVITITLDASGSADDFILIAFSAPVSAGVTFQKTFNQQTVVPGNSAGGATYGTAYVAQFGTIPAGTKVFLKLTPVNQYGFTGTPVIMVAVASQLSSAPVLTSPFATNLVWTPTSALPHSWQVFQSTTLGGTYSLRTTLVGLSTGYGAAISGDYYFVRGVDASGIQTVADSNIVQSQ